MDEKPALTQEEIAELETRVTCLHEENQLLIGTLEAITLDDSASAADLQGMAQVGMALVDVAPMDDTDATPPQKLRAHLQHMIDFLDQVYSDSEEW